MYYIKGHNTADPYMGLVTQFVSSSFPQPGISNKQLLADLIVDEILASGAVRYGPKPGAEVQVNLRQMVEHWIKLDRPIPFLAPWGSIKPDFGNIDIAELSALKVLNCLDGRIRRHYTPGTEMNLRIEDVSGYFMFKWLGEQTRPAIDNYSTNLENLVRALGMDFINPIREIRLMTEDKFAAEVESIFPIMRDRLNNVPTAAKKLEELGWTGSINAEMVEFYMSRYTQLYPEASDEKRRELIASYLAQALARVRLGARGPNIMWGGLYGEVAFVASAPGTLKHFGRRVVYRTIPEQYTKNHMPPWRAKGYLKIKNDNAVRPALASQKELKNLPLNELAFSVEGNGVTAVVQSDYLIVP